jgi:hypothetical protein
LPASAAASGGITVSFAANGVARKTTSAAATACPAGRTSSAGLRCSSARTLSADASRAATITR